MALSPSQMDRLLAMIAATRSQELSCDECLAGLAELVEAERSSNPASKKVFTEIRRHLADCGECGEEYATLLAAVTALEEEGR